MSDAGSRWRDVGLVFAGGTLGTLMRFAVTLTVPAWGAFPVATCAVNVVGAFVLGWLVETLVRLGPDVGGRRSWRLFAGTGLLGGFTTYSALAVDTEGLLVSSQVGVGLLYGATTVVVGAAASLAGVVVAAVGSRRS